MAVIQRSSPGILGIAFAIVLGLLMFTLCVPLCSTACGVAGLAGLFGVGVGVAGVADHAMDDAHTRKRKRHTIAAETESQAEKFTGQSQAGQTLQATPMSPEPDSKEQQTDDPGDAEGNVPPTKRFIKAQARVGRVCPDSVIPETSTDQLTEFCVELFATGIERSDVIRKLRRKSKRNGFTYDVEMRKCLAGIVALAQETYASQSLTGP